MASAFTHSFVALALGKISTGEKMPLRFWLLGLLCSILPDFDVVAFRLGIPYSHLFGHRGFAHSLLFAALVAVLVVPLAFRNVPRFTKKWWILTAYFFLVTASHGVLDAMTSGGYGIGFFIPFDNTRYFLPWRPLRVSPIGVYGFFSRWGWDVIKSELLWIWLPALIITAPAITIRKRFRNGQKPSLRTSITE
jgi:inner membrane protein